MAKRTTPVTDPAVAVAYLRRSKAKGDTLGIQAQRASIEAWAAREGVQVASWHVEDDTSGATPIEERPAFLEALESVEQHRAGALVVARRDRAGRGVLLMALVTSLTERLGARLVSAAGEGTDTDEDDPAGFLLRGIADLFAAYERILIGHRTKAALAAKKRRGERTGGVPYGFTMAADGVHLMPCESERETIAEARRLRDSGLTLTRIGAALTAAGRYPRQGTTWAPTQIARML